MYTNLAALYINRNVIQGLNQAEQNFDGVLCPQYI